MPDDTRALWSIFDDIKAQRRILTHANDTLDTIRDGLATLDADQLDHCLIEVQGIILAAMDTGNHVNNTLTKWLVIEDEKRVASRQHDGPSRDPLH